MTGKMGPLTGIPASIAAQMIGAGQVQQQGVFAPEGCLIIGRLSCGDLAELSSFRINRNLFSSLATSWIPY